MKQKYLAPSVKKAFQILRLIANSERGLRISDLAKSLGISKSTVHGITAALEELGTIMRDPATKRYRSGLTLLELGKSAHSQFDLKDLARPVMENLMETTQESVFLGVRNGEHITILDIVESRNDLKITSPVGTTLPLMAGATGKVFLASMDETQAIDIIHSKSIPKYTDNTILDPQHYLQEIRLVREMGYATDYEEYIPGVRAVAASIRANRHFSAAIWVVGFKMNLDDDKMRVLIKQTKEAAETISRKFEEQQLI
ncbi:MAG: IclR family transcriptional regulator [Dehalococcoidia bacterium]|nr:MAG: IclR family transcriptional regulator [Dehalococcoidia bacterium]